MTQPHERVFGVELRRAGGVCRWALGGRASCGGAHGYVLVHPDARLDGQERDTLVDALKAMSDDREDEHD